MHLPIKMQMRVGLWIRLSKQVEIKIGKKEKKKPSGLCQEEKKCRFLTQSKRETLLENLKRKAESKHSPRRFLTQICNTEYDAIQKSFLVHFHLFRNPKDCIRIEIIWQMMDNPPEERPATVPSPLSDIIRVHVVSVCLKSWWPLIFLPSVYTERVSNENTAIEKANSPLSVCAACSPSMCSLVSLHFVNLIITEAQTEGPTNSQFPIPSCNEQ